jgi:hypothetical protein
LAVLDVDVERVDDELEMMRRSMRSYLISDSDRVRVRGQLLRFSYEPSRDRICLFLLDIELEP